jgi:N-succinyldiaminopimelate aminotransferase
LPTAPLPLRAAEGAQRRHRAGRDFKPIGLGIGEPRHATPALIEEALVQALPGLSSYPATAGEPALREAFAGWLQRRYGVSVDPFTQVLPVNGSREALFALAQTLIDPTGRVPRWSARTRSIRSTKARRCWPGRRPAYFANSDPARNFAADWSQIDEADLGAHAAAVRVLAGQPHRRGDAAGGMARCCSS